LSALEITGKLLILVELERKLLRTLCHEKASLVVGTMEALAPIVPAQGAFSLGAGLNPVNNVG
ncbi:MAG: hypothetical protein R6V05_14595, partial [Candidatus Brocadiia bacterium]